MIIRFIWIDFFGSIRISYVLSDFRIRRYW